MKVKILNSYYEQSDSVIAQGREIERYEKMGYERGNGGYGTYRMNKPAAAIVTYETEYARIKENISNMIKNYYGMQRLSRKRFDEFVHSCKCGEIDLQYSDDIGLYINYD